MSYFRPSVGDGPTPCELDPTLCDPVATVSPTRVECSQLPADSPFRQPGQVCAPPPADGTGGGVMDWVLGLIKPAFGTKPGATAQDSSPSAATLLLLAGGAYVAYRYLGKGKR